MTKKKENKFWKGLKVAARWGYKAAILFSTIAMYIEPIAGSLVAVASVCKVISATFKDKTNTRFDKVNKIADGFKTIANTLALNFGKAANDPKINK